ncbi:MAG: acetyltransferase [Acidobacteriota bacterium]
MIRRVVGLGAGGHGKVIADLLRSQSDVEICGFLDPRPDLHGQRIGDILVLGDDRLLPELKSRGIDAVFIGVGGTGDTSVRRDLFQAACSASFDVMPAIHRGAIVSTSARLGRGVQVLAGAVINVDARIGDNVLINTGAIVEHDCEIGDHVHVATGARLAGGVSIGAGAHIGIGAVLRQGIRVGEHSVVGAGAVVVDHVPDRVVVVGVPSRVLRAVDG